jgi:hypothetical protein
MLVMGWWWDGSGGGGGFEGWFGSRSSKLCFMTTDKVC